MDRLRPAHHRLAARLPLVLRRHYLYAIHMGRWGNFTRPTDFNEKVNWRILHDRRPIMIDLCDKMRMKEIAHERVPELRIPQTIWHGTDLSRAPDLDAIGPWVLKPNHSSGDILFGPAPHLDVRAATATWLVSRPGRLGEWGYTRARAELLIEELLPGCPDDYKIFVFDGVPRMVQVNSGRSSEHHTQTYYTCDWRKLPGQRDILPNGNIPRPALLETMLEMAGRLGAGLDFVRVDLYVVGEEVWFGELTPYPGGGMTRVFPLGFFEALGRWWLLPETAEVAR